MCWAEFEWFGLGPTGVASCQKATVDLKGIIQMLANFLLPLGCVLLLSFVQLHSALELFECVRE